MYQMFNDASLIMEDKLDNRSLAVRLTQPCSKVDLVRTRCASGVHLEGFSIVTTFGPLLSGGGNTCLVRDLSAYEWEIVIVTVS